MVDLDLEAWLVDELGLEPRLLDRSELWSLSTRLGASSGPSLVERLLVDRALRDRVIADVVVPETWFFRDPEMHRFVCARAVESGRARILSVPCSTGEEPLGLAMSLLSAGLSPASFSIDAFDVSHQAISRATKGVFAEGSFRATEPSARDEYFEPVDGGWRISPDVAQLVSFRVGNVLDLASSTTGSYDFVLCRNLLIYLHESARWRAVAQLTARLASEGVLLLGSAELPPQKAVVARLAGAPPFVWRLPPVTPERIRASTPPPRAGVAETPAPRPRQPATTTDVPPPSSARSSTRSALAKVRALADGGELEAARRALATHERSRGPTAAMYFLKGLLYLSESSSEAEEALRKALYLDPSHEEALDHLARLLERTGASDGPQVRARLSRLRRRSPGAGP